MSITSVMSYSPSNSTFAPRNSRSEDQALFEVGAEELKQAKRDMDALDELTVNEETYEDAVDSKDALNWNWITGDDEQAARIDRQTELEDSVLSNLRLIAAANVRGQVGPEVLEGAQNLGERISSRLADDYDLASETDLSSEAYSRWSDNTDLSDALNDVQPDVIAPEDTEEFINELKGLTEAISADEQTYLDESQPQADRDAALNRLRNEHPEALNEKVDLVHEQIGYFPYDNGILHAKLAALPEDDPQRTVYENQGETLLNALEGESGIDSSYVHAAYLVLAKYRDK